MNFTSVPLSADMTRISFVSRTNLPANKFAVSLASGRYAAMNLAHFLGEDEAINFFKDCIYTAVKNKYYSKSYTFKGERKLICL